MWTTILLRQADGDFPVSFHLKYDTTSKLVPYRFLVERDLLAPFFDQEAHPVYEVKAPRIAAEFGSYGEALDRYLEIVRNWKVTESYVHPKIFRGQKPWVEGEPCP